jgi:hypothetical protein
MRPYLAIIKDSFREALASHVLWIVLGLVSVLLLLLAPATYYSRASAGLRPGDVDSWMVLIEQIRDEGKSEQASPSQRIWTLLTEDERKVFTDATKLPEQPSPRDLGKFQRVAERATRALDRLLARDDFYDAKSWEGIAASPELKELQKQDYAALSANDRQRFNRLLLEVAYPDNVSASPAKSLQFHYLVWDVGVPLPFRKSDLVDVIGNYLPWVIDTFVLSIGLLVAVLVTASIIPQMLDPGSIHLLLSKPVSRPLLYLAKFAGGCAFVLLASTYLFVGLWLILGARLGIWEPRLLWCIPIYVMAFSVYYSVTALAGLIWRNTIVAVIVTMMFWVVCTLVGWSKESFENTIRRYRIARVVPAGDKIVCCDELNTLLVWDEAAQVWQPLFTSRQHEEIRMAMIAVAPEGVFSYPEPVTGPVYDPANEQVVAASVSVRSFGQKMLFAAQHSGTQWKLIEGGPVPAPPIAMLASPGRPPLLVMNGGMDHITRNLSGKVVKLHLPGLSIPLTQAKALTSVTPEPVPYWGSPAAAAQDPASGRVAVYSQGSIELLSLPKGGRRFVSDLRKSVFAVDSESALVALGGGTCAVARQDGSLHLLDDQTLAEQARISVEPGQQPRAMLLAPDGKTLAMLFHNGELRLVDLASRRVTRAAVGGQGDISAIAYQPNGNLLVADRATRVREVELPSGRVVRTLASQLEIQEQVYYYGIRPLYFVLPKPREFYKTVQFALTDQETTRKTEGDTLAGAQKELNPWAPVRSSILFLVLSLGLGCVYIARQEF